MSNRHVSEDEKPGFVDMFRIDWPVWVVLGVVTVVTAVLYPQFPDPLPIHWNAGGEVDGTAPKWWGAWVLLVCAAGTWVLVAGLLSIVPRGEPSRNDPKLGQFLRGMTPLFVAATHLGAVAFWMGVEFSMTDFVLMASGVLIAAVGNVLGSVEPNWVIGIRLPWTLESDEVWYRTHRLAAPIWFVGGLSILLVPVFGSPVLKMVYYFAVIAVITIVPTVASYRWYRDLA